MLQNALKYYQNIERESVSGRDTEARVLTQAAMKLIKCRENWDAPDRKILLDEALRYNQKIWSIFQAELVKPDNPLPNEIKINLLNLSRFVDKRIIEIMTSGHPEKLTILIKINQNIAAGLRISSVSQTDNLTT
jgi:flagellar protein FlaF